MIERQINCFTNTKNGNSYTRLFVVFRILFKRVNLNENVDARKTFSIII